MANISTTVFVGNQAGKKILTGTQTLQTLVELLRGQTLVVNSNAQRSLIPGANKRSTTHLVEEDSVENTPRMKSFISFINRVIDETEKGVNSIGFLGAGQFAIPESFEGATLEYTDDEKRIAILKANPVMGEAAFHLSDSQGRIVGCHAAERSLVKQTVRLRTIISKKDKKGEDTKSEQKDLMDVEAALKRLRKFLSKTDFPIVIYADSEEDGKLKGISIEGERRLYLEANALNSRAAQEDMVKYESFSPVIVSLQELRTDPGILWMDEEYIEQDAKTISKSSTKLFTLSTLAQAYSLSIINDPKALKAISDTTLEQVDHRQEFVTSYWQKISEIFESVWIPDQDHTTAERMSYLKTERDNKRQVVFSAIFLQALGQLCYSLGQGCDWDVSNFDFKKLEALDPQNVTYAAVANGNLNSDNSWVVTDWNNTWTNAMMKPNIDETSYVFNNVTDSISKTKTLLQSKLS